MFFSRYVGYTAYIESIFTLLWLERDIISTSYLYKSESAYKILHCEYLYAHSGSTLLMCIQMMYMQMRQNV